MSLLSNMQLYNVLYNTVPVSIGFDYEMVSKDLIKNSIRRLLVAIIQLTVIV